MKALKARHAIVGMVWGGLFVALAGMTRNEVPPTDRSSPLATSFSADVMPILEARCVDCHGGVDENGETVVEEGLDVTTYEGLMAGSTWGTVVEAGDPGASLMIEMMDNGEMPKDAEEAMPAEEIEIIRAWIAEGAQNN